MSRCGYGHGKEMLFNQIQQVLKRLGTPNPFPDDRPTEMWYCLFMGQYPHLSRRMPSLLGRAGMKISMNNVRWWFADLRQYIEGIGHGDSFSNPTRIFNADETGFPIALKPVKIIADKGDPHIYQQGSLDKSLITALLAISAVGRYVRLMLIFLGKIFCTDFYNRFYEAIPTGQFGHSKNG